MESKEPLTDTITYYKSCQQIWIVHLQPVEGTITNIDRDNIIDNRFAKCRGNKFRVVRIENKFNPTVTTDATHNSCYDRQSLTYTVGEIAEIEDYNMDKNKVCTTGIHFFTTKEAAYQYEALVDEDGNYHGPYIDYYSSGIKRLETNYEHGEYHGSYAEYYKNGNKCIEANYVHGNHSGMYIEYNEDGSVRIMKVYDRIEKKMDHVSCKSARYY
jgi:hypothetical protein